MKIFLLFVVQAMLLTTIGYADEGFTLEELTDPVEVCRCPLRMRKEMAANDGTQIQNNGRTYIARTWNGCNNAALNACTTATCGWNYQEVLPNGQIGFSLTGSFHTQSCTVYIEI